jgi:hypothetical protein
MSLTKLSLAGNNLINLIIPGQGEFGEGLPGWRSNMYCIGDQQILENLKMT